MADVGAAGTFLRIFLRVAVGASITPEMVAGLPAMAGSMDSFAQTS
jgi:hypothetical protein